MQLNIARDELQGIIPQLEQALYNHQQWHAGVTRTLVCRLTADEHDIDPNAHKQCRFGQWYYGQTSKKLHDHPGFVEIGEAHHRMHQLAAKLLQENTIHTIQTYDYDKFANALEALRLEIYTLKRELEDTLYNHDPLTGAVTRVNMLPALREQQELAKRENQPCCIAMMDLDFFKKVNDLYGHVVGDRLLTEVIHYVVENLRPYDKIFRYGGEEFVICIQNSDIERSSEMIKRLVEGIEKLNIDIGAKDPLHISASFGYTMLDPYIPVEQSIERADKAMYAAKTAGRNTSKKWDPSMI